MFFDILVTAVLTITAVSILAGATGCGCSPREQDISPPRNLPVESTEHARKDKHKTALLSKRPVSQTEFG